jgi:hypothetical protein
MKRLLARHGITGCWCFALLVLPFTISGVAAQSTCGGIKGRVTSPQGWVIPKATILLINKRSKQTINVETDENGEYTICLSAGMYDVLATAAGYKRGKRKSIQVDESSKATIDLVLKQNGTVMSTASVSVGVESESTPVLAISGLIY